MTSRSIFGAVLIGALMFSQSASALSCARPDLVRTLEDAKDSPKIYHILVGRFQSLTRGPAFPQMGPNMPPEDQFKPKPPRLMPSYFEGYSLAKNPRRDVPLSRFPVDIEVSCIGPWCSDVPAADRELIAFVEARPGQTPVLRISPCPSQTFAADRKQVRKVRQCLDRKCQADEPNWR
jgi:hypothetical protein